MKITNVTIKKDKNGNDMKVVILEDKSTVFVNSKYNKEIFDVIDETKEVEVEKNGEFLNIKPESLGLKPKAKGGGMSGMMNAKKANINEAIEKKSANISKAQDRNESMWAKRNACELVAHHPAFSKLSINEVENKIHELAGQILNDELEPF